MRSTLRIVLLAGALALATATFGWWTVPLLALAWGASSRARRQAPFQIAVAAMLAWGALLLWAAARGPFGELASRLAGVMGVPAPALVALTLVFPALLAWSAAVVGQAIAARVAREAPVRERSVREAQAREAEPTITPVAAGEGAKGGSTPVLPDPSLIPPA